MKAFKQFVFYNNTIPIAFGILFLGAGATFAASEDAREVVVQETQRVVSTDNSYLLDTTITDATVDITIKGVTEDADSYYVEYDLASIELKDAVWQPTTRTLTLTVSKDSVVSRDLGLYAEEELAEVHGAEVRQLKEIQKQERASGVTYKALATEYSGLVGQFLDPSQEVFPGYNPLIDPQVGVPLSKDQERAHEAVRRLIEEEREKREREQAVPDGPSQDESPSGNTEEPSPESTPEPAPEPAPEAPPVIEPVVEPSPSEPPSDPGNGSTEAT